MSSMLAASPLRRPFAIRVHHDDPSVARMIARALVPMLRARGAHVTLDGEPQGGGSTYGVHIQTGGRVLPGTTVTIGVQGEGAAPRWLAPLEVSEDPMTASDQVMAFLEEWGFVPSPNALPPATGALRASAS